MLNVLIIDDDPEYQRVYRDLLEDEGYRSSFVASRIAAHEGWQRERFDAVILDKRLQGAGGPDDGIDLLRELRFSGAKVFLVTAYADDDSIRRAFELGAYDYLEKGALQRTLLRVKLDQIRELVRARQRGLPEGDRVIRELWAQLHEGSSHARGRRLEDLILLILTSIPGLQEAWRNVRTPAEEIDIAVRNETVDPFWQKQPSYLIAECKNWSNKVGTSEVAWFADKVRDRRDACLGFFFAPEGFSEPVDEKIRSYRKEGLQMVLVDRPDIEELVAVSADRRSDILKALHARWALK
ncbi:MAG: response regulator [Deltaproteobacteria bacterium]|nr:response regulator [Deltaproteobacteria bacterium]